ncbi:unnamed protein product [Aureobasidium uvarum]|uniref:Uncharacterized protein n=1 Tax=Aureobasidium uvarum TaxID=2773716 RepID=A0A9N8KFH0_9PEZI|nr:unnamed protein product [Aureobasidium uvarum]
MSTPQTRSRSRGRPASKSSQPGRPLSRIQTTAQFSDPDYDQSTPEPKTASTPSPSWGKFQGKNNGKIMSREAAAKPSWIRGYQIDPMGSDEARVHDMTPDWRGIPSVSYINPNDGGGYYMSSYCAPASHSPKADFQDRISGSNSSRAKAMASPTLGKRSTSRPKRVKIATQLDEDQGGYTRSRSSPTWRKTRLDTPSSTRASIFDFPSKKGSWNSLEGFVPRSGFIWLVLVFLGILLSLSSPPKVNPVQVAYKEVCNRFGNPAEWNCNGNFNFTIDNVISHCHSATDKIHDRFQMLESKANVEDLVHSCQSSVGQGTDKLENMFEGMSEKATATFKRSLCALPGAEEWSDCVKESASKLRKSFVMIGSVFSDPFSSTRTNHPRNSPSIGGPKIVQRIFNIVTTTKNGRVVSSTHTLSREYAYTPTAAISTIGRAESIASSVVSSLASQANGYATSKLSSASSAYLPFSSSSSSEGYTMESKGTESVSTGLTLSDGIETVSNIKDLELKHTLAVAKADLKMLQKNDSSIIAHTTYAKRQLNILLETAWDLQKDIDQFSICMIRKPEIAVHELSKTISYNWLESWNSYTVWSGWTVASASGAFNALSDPPAACQRHLVNMHQRLRSALQTREILMREVERVIDLSYQHDFKNRGPIYVPIPLPWFRAVGPFPHLPVINLPAISWNPLFWGRGEAYWYRKRTQEEREESLRLHRLRITLHQVRDASDGFDDIKNLTERGIISLLDVHNDLKSYNQKVLGDSRYGLAFLKEKLHVVKKDLALAIKFRDERKRVKNHINAIVWDRYSNVSDEHAVIVAKEMRL